MDKYDIKKVSPRPWKVFVFEGWNFTKRKRWNGRNHDQHNGQIIHAKSDKVEDYVYSGSAFSSLTVDDIRHIVHCVNEYDNLRALAALVVTPDGDGPLVTELSDRLRCDSCEGKPGCPDICDDYKAKQALASARALIQAHKQGVDEDEM